MGRKPQTLRAIRLDCQAIRILSGQFSLQFYANDNYEFFAIDNRGHS